jgi:hypothetical protein
MELHYIEGYSTDPDLKFLSLSESTGYSTKSGARHPPLCAFHLISRLQRQLLLRGEAGDSGESTQNAVGFIDSLKTARPAGRAFYCSELPRPRITAGPQKARGYFAARAAAHRRTK